MIVSAIGAGGKPLPRLAGGRPARYRSPGTPKLGAAVGFSARLT